MLSTGGSLGHHEITSGHAPEGALEYYTTVAEANADMSGVHAGIPDRTWLCSHGKRGLGLSGMPDTCFDSTDESIVSGIVTSPADALLREAIMTALRMEPEQRSGFLAIRLPEIKAFMEERPSERPWTFSEFVSTDGSRVFRDGIGHSLVVDPQGGLWRARSYEDFLTTYNISDRECSIATLTPLYEGMRRYTLE